MILKRGEVWLVDFDEHPDSRQIGIRPAVVVQTDPLNVHERYPLVIVVPFSTKGSERIPSHALIEASVASGLSDPSFAKCEQIQTLPKSHLVRRLGFLDADQLARVGEKLRSTLDL